MMAYKGVSGLDALGDAGPPTLVASSAGHRRRRRRRAAATRLAGWGADRAPRLDGGVGELGRKTGLIRGVLSCAPTALQGQSRQGMTPNDTHFQYHLDSGGWARALARDSCTDYRTSGRRGGGSRRGLVANVREQAIGLDVIRRHRRMVALDALLEQGAAEAGNAHLLRRRRRRRFCIEVISAPPRARRRRAARRAQSRRSFRCA